MTSAHASSNEFAEEIRRSKEPNSPRRQKQVEGQSLSPRSLANRQSQQGITEKPSKLLADAPALAAERKVTPPRSPTTTPPITPRSKVAWKKAVVSIGQNRVLGKFGDLIAGCHAGDYFRNGTVGRDLINYNAHKFDAPPVKKSPVPSPREATDESVWTDVGSAALYLPFKISGKDVLVSVDPTHYRIDNSQLEELKSGLNYCNSKNIEDLSDRIIECDYLVGGIVEESGDGTQWLKVMAFQAPGDSGGAVSTTKPGRISSKEEAHKHHRPSHNEKPMRLEKFGIGVAHLQDPVAHMQEGVPVVYYCRQRQRFESRVIKVDTRLMFLHVCGLRDSTEVIAPVLVKMNDIPAIYSGADAMRICAKNGVNSRQLNAASAIVIQIARGMKAEEIPPLSKVLVVIAPPQLHLKDCLDACAAQAPKHNIFESSSGISRNPGKGSNQTMEKTAGNVSVRGQVIRRIMGVKLMDWSDPVNFKLKEITLRVDVKGKSNSVLIDHYDHKWFTDVRPKDVAGEIQKLKSRLSCDFAPLDTARLKLTLVECILMRQWAEPLCHIDGFGSSMGSYIGDEENYPCTIFQDESFHMTMRDITTTTLSARETPGSYIDVAMVEAIKSAMSASLAFEQDYAQVCRKAKAMKADGIQEPRCVTLGMVEVTGLAEIQEDGGDSQEDIVVADVPEETVETEGVIKADISSPDAIQNAAQSLSNDLSRGSEDAYNAILEFLMKQSRTPLTATKIDANIPPFDVHTSQGSTRMKAMLSVHKEDDQMIITYKLRVATETDDGFNLDVKDPSDDFSDEGLLASARRHVMASGYAACATPRRACHL